MNVAKTFRINATEILQTCMAKGLGLDRYEDIIQNIDPSTPNFQKLFNGYYRVRRNDQWRKSYYTLFCKAWKSCYSFDQIITELYKSTGNIEPSFSSKMLATIDTKKPIWDKYVLNNLGLKLTGKTQEEKLQNAIALYVQIESWYEDYFNTKNAKACIKKFDQWLPAYTWMSDTKKIDCLLWVNGNREKTHTF